MTSEQGETIFYTSCKANCGAGRQCIFKAHLKNGVIVAVEPDDRYNTGIGREDDVLTEQDLLKNRIQKRPCARGLAIHRYYNPPDRVIYPLKRAPNTRRGEGKYLRVSWEEALTTVAEEMKKARVKYGPYSIMTAGPSGMNLSRLMQLWGAGVRSWGNSSYASALLMAHIVAGDSASALAPKGGGSASDMLAHSKLIVLWGQDPSVACIGGHAHQFAWFVKLCRERGKRVIIIEPRYTVSAEVLADQWIPIKPGADNAMFIGMAHALLKEDLWDKEFVEKYVEPFGFEKWKNYLLGADDGVEKSPEWAASICAVPAETIRELARTVATTRPSWLWCSYGVNRKSHGEQTMKAFAALQAMLGYWGTPGAGPPFFPGPWRPIPHTVSWGPSGEYNMPTVHHMGHWAQAVLLLDRVRSGELSEEDYIRMVGWKADRSVLREFNPKVLLWGAVLSLDTNHVVTIPDSANYQVKAIEKMDFVASMHNAITPSNRYADIILPTRDMLWEEKDIAKSTAGGWDSIYYIPGFVEPPGEAKSPTWIHAKLAEKLGIDPKMYFRYYTNDENWDRDWERYIKDCYQEVINYYLKRNINVPTWEEFSQGTFINCEEYESESFTGWDEQIKEGKPFQTQSGKIEIYSNYIADEANRAKGEHYDSFGRPYSLPSDWDSMPPMPIYRPAVRGMDDPLVKEYPLMLLTPHPRHRAHWWPWNTPWLREHVYRHRVWINLVDAKARGISDNNMVQVYNDRGKVVIPAYVTSRVMPGVVVMHHGGQYTPDESGVDWGGASSTLLGGDFESCATPFKATTLVQIEKYGGEQQ